MVERPKSLGRWDLDSNGVVRFLHLYHVGQVLFDYICTLEKKLSLATV